MVLVVYKYNGGMLYFELKLSKIVDKGRILRSGGGNPPGWVPIHDFAKIFEINPWNYKNVLLRERKRHTAHCVLSTPSVVLPGYPPPSWPGQGGYPPAGGYPPVLTWPGEYPTPPQHGTPQQDTPPVLTWPGAVPYLGNPPGRVPPSWTWQGTPQCLSHGILGNIAKHYGIWVPPLWTDRWMDGQTRVKTLPSRRTTYSGGKNKILRGRCAPPPAINL